MIISTWYLLEYYSVLLVTKLFFFKFGQYTPEDTYQYCTKWYRNPAGLLPNTTSTCQCTSRSNDDTSQSVYYYWYKYLHHIQTVDIYWYHINIGVYWYYACIVVRPPGVLFFFFCRHRNLFISFLLLGNKYGYRICVPNITC